MDRKTVEDKVVRFEDSRKRAVYQYAHPIDFPKDILVDLQEILIQDVSAEERIERVEKYCDNLRLKVEY